MRVLIVDGDNAGERPLEQALTRAGYSEVRSAPDAIGACQLCAASPPDLVLLDLDLPGRSADQVIEQLRPLIDAPESLPVLVLGAGDALVDRDRALLLGARDFVAKPVDPTELLLRVRNLLQTRQLQQQLADRNALLSEAVQMRTGELDSARRESLTLLASIAEYHDDDNYQHTQRVGICAARIARALELPEPFIATIRDAAPLHDIGKVGISRRILLKPGQLTPAEWVHMTRHVEIGAQILGSAQSPALRRAAEIARTHHERWDGNGYLSGLSGADIPLAGRITAVADVFDVLTHERPYSRAWELDRALAEIHSQSGRQFDPQVVAAFATIDPQTLSGEDAHLAA
jgi:putative two-component system response regulator